MPGGAERGPRPFGAPIAASTFRSAGSAAEPTPGALFASACSRFKMPVSSISMRWHTSSAH